jgi:hypothetical protein
MPDGLSERDSSGTTEQHEAKRNAAKVMERIARREHPTHQRCGGAKRLAQIPELKKKR